MTPTEAEMLKIWLRRIDPIVILNFGSSTREFRTKDQPFIQEALEGYDVVHIDKKQDEGVDIQLDLESNKPGLMDHILPHIQLPIGTVFLLQNVLEHVQDREQVLKNVTSLRPQWLIVSVPYKWPYHPDPIDTQYRPTVDELSELIIPYGYEPVCLTYCEDSRGSIALGMFHRKEIP